MVDAACELIQEADDGDDDGCGGMPVVEIHADTRPL